MSVPKHTVATQSNHVRVSFAAKEDGTGRSFIAIEDDSLMPNTIFAFTLKAGISLEDARALVATLRSKVDGMSFTVLADVDGAGGTN